MDIEDLDHIEQGISELQLENLTPGHDLDTIRDPDALFDGNVRLPGYYRAALNALNPENFIRKNYAKGTAKLIANTENQWHLYVLIFLHMRLSTVGLLLPRL